MKKVTIHIALKQGVLDPQGQTIQTSLHSLGFTEVEEVRTGKTVELFLEDSADIEARVHEMCDKLLANPVIEDYSLEVEEALRT
ncbi:phosphoribosylformylglycinamidine synthase subunit PurS [Lentibacillus cibarius]|uniref:Phosphoribosylformylglycinamidine synthase subunit PurS n=1 Tax=Lentibacillus cibarius TaxID=2583219 RepID=A0A549YI57_9BACI|nr:phosphoribosylformylglycinamidine synthase subunit PurS [Lentibacillus cibarius]TMN22774.1 phosphoribosylformylglycinamidine synthase subunit PurS [Lentibacillus cibarius]TRM11563.1 phosphoribosylformylglycinamidine synthase subunit PurS [Lentibacillus cibarius]